MSQKLYLGEESIVSGVTSVLKEKDRELAVQWAEPERLPEKCDLR